MLSAAREDRAGVAKRLAARIGVAKRLAARIGGASALLVALMTYWQKQRELRAQYLTTVVQLLTSEPALAPGGAIHNVRSNIEQVRLVLEQQEGAGARDNSFQLRLRRQTAYKMVFGVSLIP